MSIHKITNYYKYSLFVLIGVLASAVAFCQTEVSGKTSISFDTITKIITTGGIILGAIMTYVTLKTANSISVVKADFQQAINQVKMEFSAALHNESDKMEGKLQLAIKEVQIKMATTHDINGLKQLMMLQHENTKEQIDGLRRQVDIVTKMNGKGGN